MKDTNKNIQIYFDKEVYENFVKITKKYEVKPTRVIICLVEEFISQDNLSKEFIYINNVISNASKFWKNILDGRTELLKENRISGDESHKINKLKKESK
jgi:hypothetical protein